jgi:hypothetical protein
MCNNLQGLFYHLPCWLIHSLEHGIHRSFQWEV